MGASLVLTDEAILLAFLFLIVAILYASVGQAGATGYLAAMGMVSISPPAMKTTALSLNLVVAGIGTIQFWRRGALSLRTFYPFAILGFPFSLIGGAIQLPSNMYYGAVGLILLLSAAQMVRSASRDTDNSPDHSSVPPFLPALVTGAIIGFVSGTTGTGGGIFLAPVILMMNWLSLRTMAAVTAAYNLLNSAAALMGAYSILGTLPPALPLWLLAVAIGGTIGAIAGYRYLPERALRYLLALLLVVAGAKLILS
jgi:uncharacterized membrane protein YfcA